MQPNCIRMPAAVLVLAAATALAGPAAHAATYMDTLANVAGTYNVYVSGDMGSPTTSVVSDTEGKIAAGGSVYLQNYDVGLKNSGGDALIAGQNLVFNGGTVHGNVVAGGTANFPSGSTVAGTVSAGGGIVHAPTSYGGAGSSSVPLDFSGIDSDLASASSFLHGSAAESQGVAGTWSNSYGTVTLHSSATSGLVFFDLAASNLAGISGLDIDVASTATVIVNLTGELGGAMTNYGMWGTYDETRTLFNFVDATTLTLTNFGMHGSILAPNAAVSGTWGNIDGSLMAASFSGSTQLNWHPFAGSLPVPPEIPRQPNPPVTGVPEPSTWALLLAGFGAMGAMLRRRSALATA
jgi:choice-of-anchor A domain-containing protein